MQYIECALTWRQYAIVGPIDGLDHWCMYPVPVELKQKNVYVKPNLIYHQTSNISQTSNTSHSLAGNEVTQM